MTPVSIGDMAQVFLLRRYNTAASRELGDLSADLARGTASDIGRHMGGQISPLAAIESALAKASAHREVVGNGATKAAAMQAALERINVAANSNAAALLRAAQSGEASGLSTVAHGARAALDDVLAALNTRAADQSLFSGMASDGNALPDAETVLAAARAVIGAPGLPKDAAVAIAAWLDDPNGFPAQVYLGAMDATTIPLAQGETAKLDVNAADPALRETLKGLILGALMSDAGYSSAAAQTDLARLAGNTLLSSADARVTLSARLGLTEQRLAEAQSRHASEHLLLQQARSDLVAIDGYETATRLAEAEARLEMIYTLTSRLSRLTLADYL